MANIAFVKNVGSVNSSNKTTVTVTVPAAGCAVGNLLVFRIQRAATDADPTVTDTHANTWTKLASYVTASPTNVVFYCVLAQAMVSSDTIVATFAAMSNRVGVVDEWSGVATSPVEGTPGNTHGTSTTPSASTTQTSAACLIYGSVHVAGPITDTYTEDADSTGGDTWHALTRVEYSGSNDKTSNAAYKITTSATAQTYDPTITSNPWAEILGAFKGTDQPAGNPPLLDPPVRPRFVELRPNTPIR
jgi:hypothetical protein